MSWNYLISEFSIKYVKEGEDILNTHCLVYQEKNLIVMQYDVLTEYPFFLKKFLSIEYVLLIF